MHVVFGFNFLKTCTDDPYHCTGYSRPNGLYPAWPVVNARATHLCSIGVLECKKKHHMILREFCFVFTFFLVWINRDWSYCLHSCLGKMWRHIFWFYCICCCTDMKAYKLTIDLRMIWHSGNWLNWLHNLFQKFFFSSCFGKLRITQTNWHE